MTKTIAAPKPSTVAAPVAMHYVRKELIGTGRPAVALCGEQGTSAQSAFETRKGDNSTSYTCPDCMIRYMLLAGGDSNG